MTSYIFVEIIMIRNLARIAGKEAKIIRPHRRGLGRFGARKVGVRRNTVDTYAV
jgi:hypothetical protein